MAKKLTDEQLLKNIRETLDLFQREFIDHLDSFEKTMRSRLLGIFKEWKQVNLRRIVDIADAASEMFRQGRLVPACTLTRSVFETVGIQYYMHKKIVEHTKNTDPESIHKLLVSGVSGRKDIDSFGMPIQVLTAIDHMDKEFQGSRSEYDHLCEYAHPNLKGGFGTYVRTDDLTLEAYFGINPQGLEMSTWGLGSLHIILIIGTEINKRLNAFQPEFENMVKKHAPDQPYYPTTPSSGSL